MTTSVLAEASEVRVNTAELERMFQDLVDHGSVVATRTRGGSGCCGVVRDGGSAADVLLALELGNVLQAQVRYERCGEEWIDTVLREADGFRVVRIHGRERQARRDKNEVTP